RVPRRKAEARVPFGAHRVARRRAVADADSGSDPDRHDGGPGRNAGAPARRCRLRARGDDPGAVGLEARGGGLLLSVGVRATSSRGAGGRPHPPDRGSGRDLRHRAVELVKRLRRARIFALTAILASPALAEDILKLPIGDPARRDRPVPVVLDAITDASSGAAITPAELPSRLSSVRLLLVGEEHTNMDSHRVELAVIEALVRSGRKVTVALEMFPYTEQKLLDDWSAGRLSEDEFLAPGHWYKSWGYNWLYYRDVFLFARDRRLPMVAVNAPREVVSAVRKKGFQGLTAEEAAHIPSKIDADSPEPLRLFKASFDDPSFHASMDEEGWKAMLAAQCT